MPDVSGIILSKNKVHENPFTGVLENNTDIPKSEIQHDLNKITIETRYKLLFSFSSIKRKKKYKVTHKINKFPIEGEWTSVRETESVLNATKSIVIFAQHGR